MAPSNQPKHTYPVELYYVILAIAVVLAGFLLYNLLGQKSAEVPVVTTPLVTPKHVVTNEEKAAIADNFSADQVKLSTAQKTKITKTFAGSTSTKPTQEQKNAIVQSYHK